MAVLSLAPPRYIHSIQEGPTYTNCMTGWMDEEMNSWMDGQTHECTNGIMTYEGILRARRMLGALPQSG